MCEGLTLGIIGSIFGWAVGESGHHVVHLVWSGRASALRNGLTLDMFDRRGHKGNFRGAVPTECRGNAATSRDLRVGHRTGRALCVGENPHGSRPQSGGTRVLAVDAEPEAATPASRKYWMHSPVMALGWILSAIGVMHNHIGSFEVTLAG
jgi:hypothetical protein